MKRIFFIIVFTFSMSSFCSGSVISDIDKSSIELSTQFDGTSLLVFGALSADDKKTYLLIEVIGPPTMIEIRKKVKIWGIWVNKKFARFDNIPSFYEISISNPENVNLSKIEDEKLKKNFSVPLDNGIINENGYSEEKYFFELIRLKKQLGKLRVFEKRINIKENKLFSYVINLPEKVYPGKYKVKMTLLNQIGTVLSESEQNIDVSKVGIQEFLSSNSKNNPVFYGLFSVIIALFLGFSAAQLFRWLYR